MTEPNPFARFSYKRERREESLSLPAIVKKVKIEVPAANDDVPAFPLVAVPVTATREMMTAAGKAGETTLASFEALLHRRQ